MTVYSPPFTHPQGPPLAKLRHLVEAHEAPGAPHQSPGTAAPTGRPPHVLQFPSSICEAGGLALLHPHLRVVGGMAPEGIFQFFSHHHPLCPNLGLGTANGIASPPRAGMYLPQCGLASASGGAGRAS